MAPRSLNDRSSHCDQFVDNSVIKIYNNTRLFAGGSERETEPHRAVVEGEGHRSTGGRQSGHSLPERYQRGG